MNNVQNIFITGGSSGIGYQAILSLLKQGHRLTIPCRSVERREYLINRLYSQASDNCDLETQINVLVMDLSDLHAIEKLTKQLLNNEHTIDTLVLNAGLQYTGSSQPWLSHQGLELTFAVNHLSHYYLTNRLMPLLYKSINPRIIITASEVHDPKSPGGSIGMPASIKPLEGLISLQTKRHYLLDGTTKFNADKAYKDSKLCNILFARELSKRLILARKKLPVIAWAPGLVIPKSRDGFFRYSRKNNEFGQILFALIARDLLNITETCQNAGELLSMLVTSKDYLESNFIYLCNRLIRPGKHEIAIKEVSQEGLDDNLARSLWDLSAKLVKRYVSLAEDNLSSVIDYQL